MWSLVCCVVDFLFVVTSRLCLWFIEHIMFKFKIVWSSLNLRSTIAYVHISLSKLKEMFYDYVIWKEVYSLKFETLLNQSCKVEKKVQNLYLSVLMSSYDAFSLKHFHTLMKIIHTISKPLYQYKLKLQVNSYLLIQIAILRRWLTLFTYVCVISKAGNIRKL